MAPTPKNTKQHFTHPKHLLFEYSSNRVFRCDGCYTQGFGRRYRCDGCDFDLHEFCANCPRTMSSFMHPHELNLLIRKAPDATQPRKPVTCTLCGESIDGLFYSCSKHFCFYAHPICTQLPYKLRHVIDNKHSLRLQSRSPGVCAVCNSKCSSWCYGCDICQVNIHPKCLMKPFDLLQGSTVAPPQSPRRKDSSSRGMPFAPPTPPPWSKTHPHASGSRTSHAHRPFHSAPYNGYWVPHACPHGFVPFPHHGNQQSQVGSSSSNGGTISPSMFALINNLAVGVLSDFIFGSISSLFS